MKICLIFSSLYYFTELYKSSKYRLSIFSMPPMRKCIKILLLQHINCNNEICLSVKNKVYDTKVNDFKEWTMETA